MSRVVRLLANGTLRGLVLGSLVLAATAEATPRYAATVGQNCNLCHHNPTGGGMRSLYASQYLMPKRFAMKAIGEGEESPVNPQIGDEVTIGADLRTFHLWDDDREAGGNFLQMQGAVYLAFEPAPGWSLYLHEEFGQGAAEAYEVYGMGYVLPKNGYVKVGKFAPAFGWKVPDHRAFTRREYVFLPPFPPHADTGVEAGIYPGPFSLEASVTNGTFSVPRDSDRDLAYAARGAYRYTNGKRGINLSLGGSYYQNGEPGDGVWAGGPFGSAAWKGFAWVGELDWSHTEDPSTSQTALVLSQEFSYKIIRGLEIVAVHDFFDPRKDYQTGSVQRVGGGLEALPFPFLSVQAYLYGFVPDAGSDIEDRYHYTEDDLMSSIQVHFLY
jgi:hypothetical protein